MTVQPINYTYKHSDRFTELCKPIFDTSPISFCSIARIFSDGTYTGFMSDPRWTDLYVNKKHYLPTLAIWIENQINRSEAGYDLWTLSSVFSVNAATKELHNDCNSTITMDLISLINTQAIMK